MLLLSAGLWLGGCKQPYRIGEYVLVEWEEGRIASAFITEKTGRSRYRVHFDNYDCEMDVSLERFRGRVQNTGHAPELSAKAPCGVLAVNPKARNIVAPLSIYKPGDHIKVTWRGSEYSATILEVVAHDRFRIHYDGFENAWDETIAVDRISNTKRQ